MYCSAAAAGCGQALGLSGEVWEWVFVPEVRVCIGAAAELRKAAGGILPGVQGALRQYGEVYAERERRAGLSQRVGDLCALYKVERNLWIVRWGWGRISVSYRECEDGCYKAY